MSTHRTWIELNGAAVGHNVDTLRSCLLHDTTLFGVIKANAYGHGLADMARLLDRHGVKHLAVDSIEEGVSIRGLLPHSHILVMGYVPDDLLELAIHHELELTLYHLSQALRLEQLASAAGVLVRIHIKVETGTARQGVFPDDLPDFVRNLAKLPHLQIVGLSTHFARAEDLTATPFTRTQTDVFYAAVGSVATHLSHLEYVHAACSAAILCHPKSHGTAVRAGLALYGVWPSEEVEVEARSQHLSLHLQPVLSWYTRVAQIKDYPAGTPIGYGGTEVLNRPTRVAVVPVGYYDGFDRRLSRVADVLIRGHRCKVLGIVCMNMMMVDTSRVPSLEPGDRVTLIGQDGGQHIAVTELAKRSGTIPWEILARLSGHLPRVIT